MRSSKNHTDDFEHFEITYEEEPTIQMNIDLNTTKLEKPAAPKKKKKTKKDGIDLPLSPHTPEPEGLQPLSFSSSDSANPAVSRQPGKKQLDYKLYSSRTVNRRSHKTYDNTGNHDREQYEEYDGNEHEYTDSHVYRRTKLAAPIRKGGDTVLRMVQSVVRNLSAILILASIMIVLWHFWRSSTPYGDFTQAFQALDFPPALAAYLSIVALIVLYELISLLWTMSKPLFHDKYGSYRADVGRGSVCFICFYLSSYAAFWIHDFIPEWTELFRGVKGALDVFGSLHNLLFGLCLVGTISCLVRKYSSSL